MELSGLNHRIDPRRVAAISRAGARFLRDWPAGATPATVWAGGRPMTPDGLPVIGMAPGVQNLAIASGHAMLGVTLAPATGEAIADLLTTGEPPAVIAPFQPSRFH
jgi:D-amino-acid dehydrogenase